VVADADIGGQALGIACLIVFDCLLVIADCLLFVGKLFFCHCHSQEENSK
jgi:hypothetical protein